MRNSVFFKSVQINLSVKPQFSSFLLEKKKKKKLNFYLLFTETLTSHPWGLLVRCSGRYSLIVYKSLEIHDLFPGRGFSGLL